MLMYAASNLLNITNNKPRPPEYSGGRGLLYEGSDFKLNLPSKALG